MKENQAAIFCPQKRMKGGISVENTTCSFVEVIGGVTFIVNVKPAEKAKQPVDEFVKALITKESMALDADCA